MISIKSLFQSSMIYGIGSAFMRSMTFPKPGLKFFSQQIGTVHPKQYIKIIITNISLLEDILKKVIFF